MGQEAGPKLLKLYEVEVSPHQLVCVSPEDFKSYGTSVRDFCRESDRDFCKAKAREGLCIRRKLFRAQSPETAKAVPKVSKPKKDKPKTADLNHLTLQDGQIVTDPNNVIPNFLGFLRKFGKISLQPPGPVIRDETADPIAQGWGRDVWLGKHQLGRVNYEAEPPRISFNGYLPGIEKQIVLTYVWEHPLTKFPGRTDGWMIPFP